jgi:cell division septation protein DedD
MPVEREDSARELRLEGAGLVAVGAVLVALLGGAFWAGRWVERRGQPSRAALAADEPGPLSHVVEPATAEDATRDAGYFDRVDGRERQAEPRREVQTRSAQSPPPAAGQPPAELAAGFYVQVFAGRDQAAANQIIDRLRGAGYEVRLFPESESNGEILRVRVGGYPSEERARIIAGNLRQSGYADAFVTRVE